MAAVATMPPRQASGGEGDESELRELIRRRSFRLGHFTLASGAQSDLYFNLKPTMMCARGAYLSARAFLDRIHGERVEMLGGLEMGAVPLIAAVAALSSAQGAPVETFFVRKQVKAHGTRDLIEGLGPDESLAGKAVMVADDVATTGGSIILAVDAARGAGAVVETALVLVDRQEGAEARLAEHGVRLLAVFTASQFR